MDAPDGPGEGVLEARAREREWKLDRGIDLGAERRWRRSGKCEPLSGDASSFSVLTMNTLADGLGLDQFVECDPAALRWEHRRGWLQRCLLRDNPDVVCLQEVNRYSDFLQGAMTAEGYDGVFERKLRSPCEAHGFPPDGCALFFRRGAFALLACERVELAGQSQIALVAQLRRRGAAALDLTRQRSNSEFSLASVSAASTTDAASLPPMTPLAAPQTPLSAPPAKRARHSLEEPDLIVIVTHLKAKPAFEELRERQVEELLARVQALRLEHPAARFVLAGDLNAEPGGRAVQRLLKDSDFTSAYAAVGLQSDPIFYTTCKVRAGEGEVRRVIDYLFSIGLDIVDALDVPPELPAGRLPCWSWPSDHLSLHVVLRPRAGELVVAATPAAAAPPTAQAAPAAATVPQL
jgi:nocturnin